MGKRQKEKPFTRKWAVADGVRRGLKWKDFPDTLVGYGNQPVPNAGEVVHSLMRSGECAVFRIIEVLEVSHEEIVFQLTVKPLGYLKDLEMEV